MKAVTMHDLGVINEVTTHGSTTTWARVRAGAEEVGLQLYATPIVIGRTTNGTLTWRGLGQMLPAKCTFVGVAKLVFRGNVDNLIAMLEPIAIEVTEDVAHAFRTGYKARWQQHRIGNAKPTALNPCLARFLHIEQFENQHAAENE